MNIRKASYQDIDRMMEIYAYAREQMAKNGNPIQWGPTQWPPQELIEHDILEGHSYVCENGEGKIIATFYYNYGKDIEPTYLDIMEGTWMNDQPYGVIHRLASDGSEKGIGTYCIQWVYEQCHHIRIDTHGDNWIMQKLLEKIGFQHCGTIYVQEDNYPRLAYEKVGK